MSNDLPISPKTIDSPDEVPYLNTVHILVEGIYRLSQQETHEILLFLQGKFFQPITIRGLTMELTCGLSGDQAFWYASRTIQQAEESFPLVKITAMFSHSNLK